MPKTSDSTKKKSLLDRLPGMGHDDPSAPRRRPVKGEPTEKEKLDAVKTVQDLLNKWGAQVEPVVYSLLCERQNPLRATVDHALRNGTRSAVAVLIPLLIAQFALAPAVAVIVAGVLVRTIATKGQEKLCEELAEARLAKTRVKRHVAAKPEIKSTGARKAKPRTTQPAPTKKRRPARHD